MAFPSHFRSQTQHSLFHMLSQLSSASTIPTQNNVPDNGNGRMGQENQKKIQETIEVVGDHNKMEIQKDLSANKVVLKGTENEDLEEGEIQGDFGMEETTQKVHENSSPLKIVDSRKKRKHDRGSQEKKDETKKNYGKQPAENNKEQGAKRLKLQPVQKPKVVNYCRHFKEGRCYEGDKCKFSHDTVPKTKSKPCTFFARGTCLKGDACPYDHHLSKYPCYNFVSSGSCGRGDACMFSHQVPANQVTPGPSNISKPELKSPLMSGNTNFTVPPNNYGCSSVQQNHLTNSKGIHSNMNAEHKVINTSNKQPTPVPKGVRFMNVAKLSPSPSTLRQTMVTPNKECLVQNGTRADQSASSTSQNKVEIPKKSTPKGVNFLAFGKGRPVCSFRSPVSSNVNRESSTLKQGRVTPNKESLVQNGTHVNQSASGTTQKKVENPKKSPVVIPKGINFLSFGKGPVCSFRSPVSSNVNRENSVKLSQVMNFVLPEKASSSLNKDDSDVKRHMN